MVKMVLINETETVLLLQFNFILLQTKLETGIKSCVRSLTKVPAHTYRQCLSNIDEIFRKVAVEISSLADVMKRVNL